MMTKEDFTKTVNFMTLRTKTLVIGRDHLSHKVKMNFFSLLGINQSNLCNGDQG